VTITQSGSYRLTGLLLVPDANLSGIVVTALRTTIDFAGFEIRGPNQKPTNVADCTAPGFGDGVRSTLSVTVKNGRVSGMGDDGVSLGPGSRIESMTATQNCGSGLSASYNSFVLNSAALLNAIGVDVGAASLVRDTIADANSLDGILTADNAAIEGCIATNNLGAGIRAGANTVVGRCVAVGNSGDGISLGSGSVVTNSATGTNGRYGVSASTATVIAGSAVTGNTSHGVSADAGSTVVYNSLRGNGGFGVSAPQQTGIGGNTLDANGSAGIPAGVALTCNAISGVASCPQ
jgi:hypothetical protein